jgi:hypothetical protein
VLPAELGVVTKTPFPKATEFQFAVEGRVLAVHVAPLSALVAAVVLLVVATATKALFP